MTHQWSDSFPRGTCWVAPEHRVVFVATTKCASSTISSCVKRSCPDAYKGRVCNLTDDERDFWTCAVLRNPFDRFVSSYLALCRRKANHTGRRYLHRDPSTDGMLALLDDIRREGFFDVHIIPQVDFLWDCRIDQLLDMDHLDFDLERYLWPRIGKPKHYIRRNRKPIALVQSTNALMTDRVLDGVVDVYSGDFRLWYSWRRVPASIPTKSQCFHSINAPG